MINKNNGIKGILSLHESNRHVSSPSGEAEEAEYKINLYLDLLEKGIIPPGTSFERFEKELHDFDHGKKRQQMPPRRYAKSDEPFDPVKEWLKLHDIRQRLTPEQLSAVDDLVERMSKAQEKEKEK